LVNYTGAAADLITAAAMTQGANEIIHMLVTAFHDRYPDFTSVDKIMALLLGPTSAKVQDDISSEDSQDTWNVSQKLEHRKLGGLFQRTYLETFKLTNDASMEKQAADSSDAPVDCRMI
jgi:hypothetical protein